MARTTVTPEALTLNTRSADILETGGVSAATTSDGWAIAAPVSSDSGGVLVIRFWNDATAATVSVKAGDNPPAVRAGLGDLEIVLGGSDVRYGVFERARFLQDDGTITLIDSDDAVELSAMYLPREYAV